MITISFTVPIRVVNASNERVHWSVKAKRSKKERNAVINKAPGQLKAWPNGFSGGRQRFRFTFAAPPALPVVVTLTRIYTSQRMDVDGNVTALKACQDAVAELLDLDDGEVDKVTWRYAQAKGAAYAVVIEIEPRAAEVAHV